MTLAIEIQTLQGEARADSREIASALGNQHRNVLTLIESHIECFEDLGSLSFETRVRVGQQISGGGLPERYVMLNEDQCYFLLTLVRNSALVVPIKLELVKAFSRVREMLSRPAPSLPDFTDPVAAARAWADAKEAEQRTRAELVQAEQQVAALTPQAQQFQALMSADGTYSMADAAKILGTGQNRLFDLLRERGILMDKARSGREHHNLPYQPYIDREYFKVVTRPRPDGEALTQTTRVTPKGLAWLQRKMAENNLLPVLPPKGARQQVQA